VCGARFIAVGGQLRGLAFKVALTADGFRQLVARPGRTQVGKLAHRVGQQAQQCTVVLAERRGDRGCLVLEWGVQQGPGDGASPGGECLEGVDNCSIRPRYGPLDVGPRVLPQALPRASHRGPRLLCCGCELSVVP
jgi:hypothetical protein